MKLTEELTVDLNSIAQQTLRPAAANVINQKLGLAIDMTDIPTVQILATTGNTTALAEQKPGVLAASSSQKEVLPGMMQISGIFIHPESLEGMVDQIIINNGGYEVMIDSFRKATGNQEAPDDVMETVIFRQTALEVMTLCSVSIQPGVDYRTVRRIAMDASGEFFGIK